eukprot:gene1411-4577_t
MNNLQHQQADGFQIIKPANTDRKDEELFAELCQELVMLKHEKETLLRKLRQRDFTSSIKENFSKSNIERNAEKKDHLIEEVYNSITENSKRSKICELQRAYRLGGSSLFAINPTTICVRFETSFRGKFFEEYFAVLIYDQTTLQLSQHTLPMFLPLQQLQYLAKTNLTQFLEETSALLQAFVARREQLKELEEKAEDKQILSSPSCMHAELFLTVEDQLVKARLEATDAHDTLFSELKLFELGSKQKRRLAVLEHRVLTSDLSLDLRKLFLNQQACLQSTRSLFGPDQNNTK